VFLQKHQLFLLNLTLRSDLIPATPGIGISESGLVTFLERSWYNYLLGKQSIIFILSASSLVVQRTKQRILGNGWAKNLYQESSNFIPIPELKKNITRLFFTTEGILASSCSSSSSSFQVHFGFYH